VNTRILWAVLVGVTLLIGGCFMPRPVWMGSRLNRTYDSNGEQIYFTGVSQRGTPITFDMHDNEFMGGMRMMGGAMACVDCHGPDGRGGRVQMMMSSFVAPDIRYATLTAGEMEHGEEEGHGDEEHPPYTEETLKRAITQGINPAGEPLDWPMPRWSMSEADLNDLIDYLQSLE